MTSSNPANAGETLEVYLTGLGEVNTGGPTTTNEITADFDGAGHPESPKLHIIRPPGPVSKAARQDGIGPL